MHKTHKYPVPVTTLSKRQKILHVQGLVQGVGFRPFVYTLARRLGLTGRVANTGKGVEIILCGDKRKINRFIQGLETSPPPLAHITNIDISSYQGQEFATDFVIIASKGGDQAATLISPDIATCDDCLNDIFFPAGRRYHYPFTNCTNCGPRLTIIRHIPYDRQHTSMAGFSQCPACTKEYTDPGNRRFHAQPNGCPKCGPMLSWHAPGGRLIESENEPCLTACADALHDGRIVAIKGLGGFHLAADASSDAAVARLRSRKQRYAKPLAVMTRNLATAATFCHLNAKEKKLLTARERPIVLASEIPGILSSMLHPGIHEIGIMLPYTPLHHLLFARSACPDALVMTSGNLSGEPICTTNDDALARLDSIADFFLLHNREIVTRIDDSVVRGSGNAVQMLRRSRGYVPSPITVRHLKGSILACGAELKNTFCLTRSEEAFLSQHIGDLSGPDNLIFFEESIRYLQDVLQISPKAIACDLHPDYLSSRYAAMQNLPCIKIQHHHAHAGAIMAEHGITEGLAVIFDGAGLGADNTIWGGEFLYVRGASCTRVGHLAPFALPGGDRATREIWRLSLALLAGTGMDITDTALLPRTLHLPAEKSLAALRTMMGKGINAPISSSVGRLFDGVAALLGIRQQVDFEGQAAMELESLARQAYRNGLAELTGSRYQSTLGREDETLLMDYRPLFKWLMKDLQDGVPTGELACYFHIWLVRSTLQVILSLIGSQKLSKQAGEKILLGGGCFQNTLLLELLVNRLKQQGLKVYTGSQVPVNDGGIALGQAYLAGQQLTF